MALFFDQQWFREQLEAAGKSHDALAAAAGLTLAELAALWKDQREVTALNVAAFARVLEQSPAEVAARCGIATPFEGAQGKMSELAPGDITKKLEEVLGRLDRLEKNMAALEAAQKIID
jgi:hypothetical protein